MDKKLAAIFLMLTACGAPKREPVEAEIDTSCGIDCAAQNTFGLLVGRCFEYSASNTGVTPADIGVVVKPVEQLEGGINVLPVEYRQSGQIKMTDYFRLEASELFLVRRTFLPGQSVTYKDSTGALTGVKWLWNDALPGENHTTSTTATVVGFGTPGDEKSTYRVVFSNPTANELSTPLMKYETGMQMLLSETPDHGVDTRRIFVANTGFVQFNTAFSVTPGTPSLPYKLQKVRDLKEGDLECGFGAP